MKKLSLSTLFMESGVRELVEDAFNEIINKGGIHKKG